MDRGFYVWLGSLATKPRKGLYADLALAAIRLRAEPALNHSTKVEKKAVR